jgi:hypothetical protein
MPFYAGFETARFPGPKVMDWLKQHTNLKWCGYYLAPAPNRTPSGWTGQYGALAAHWGLVPIYVGQQEKSTGNGSNILSAAQGDHDATGAANLAAADGFPAHTCIFLDWESGDFNDAGAADYIGAWISGVAADKRYSPGVYCSHAIAPSLVTKVIDKLKPAPAVRFWCWKVPSNDLHDFKGDITALPQLDPAGCGFAGATIWQRENRADVTLPAGAPIAKLEMDFDTASMANPAAPA